MDTNQNNNSSFFQSNTAKIIMVGLLTLFLLIPLQLVKNLIAERAGRQKEVINDINEKWGNSVYFYGPVLKVPYTKYEEEKVVNPRTKEISFRYTPHTEYAYFFPDELKAQANVKTQEKHRSNYQSVIFSSAMQFTGNYLKPNFNGSDIDDEDIQWNKASLIIRTNNIKGIKGGVNMQLAGQSYAFEPVAEKNPQDTVATLETRHFSLADKGNNMDFSLKINFNGSEQIKLIPIGKNTEATMQSNWPSPGFTGNFLPENKTITGNGFTSSWNISFLNRPFAQQYFGVLPDLSDYSFDVDFVIPVDQYQQTERASKYGFLVIGLTFLVFFLIQTISKISIHIFQYTMIGLALIMFYTLLISITEHSSFLLAYLIAGISVVVMITLYSVSILKNRKFPAFIALSLMALYSFIYVIIQLEDYALLVGSIGLFFILSAVMYFSRKIDWNSNQRQIANP